MYIIFLGILGLIVIYPYGNVSSVDAYFFGASGSTESGLNTVDVKALALYQQLVIYFIPILASPQFINTFVVVARLVRFRRILAAKAQNVASRQEIPNKPDDGTSLDISEQQTRTVHAGNGNEPQDKAAGTIATTSGNDLPVPELTLEDKEQRLPTYTTDSMIDRRMIDEHSQSDQNSTHVHGQPTHISFAPGVFDPTHRANASIDSSDDEDEHTRRAKYRHQLQNLPALVQARSTEGDEANFQMRRRAIRRGSDTDRISLQRVVSNIFVLDENVPRRTFSGSINQPYAERRNSNSSHRDRASAVQRLKLSANAIMGRNSNFANLSEHDKDRLGGIEYRSLKLLLKIILGYHIGMHVVGTVCLTAWIYSIGDPKYRDYLSSTGSNPVWWAIYSAQTMTNNLGFTLTPDSMISFRDAVFPILVMTILAYAGHNFYPIFLRLVIWTMSKLCKANARIQEPLHFLLEHPRRCYTLLFPAKPTWILLGILFVLNFIDVIFIICLDLNNPEVTAIPVGPRIISSIFQAASSRHTGTSTFNLANVNSGVQFSLLVMMYISVFPIALSVRSSNTYEETALGKYASDEDLDEGQGGSYLKTHIHNQLWFDLWYIFLGCFVICCAESDRVMDPNEPAFAIFPILFEVTSAYGNVGLSLGYPTVLTSLCGQFGTFSKLVICAMMIRGRHRGLPVRLDRAIILPDDTTRRTLDEESICIDDGVATRRLPRLKQSHTE